MTYRQLLLKKILQQHGQSLTTGRQMLVNILWEQEPMSISQILDKVGGKQDPASLYRTIKLFEKIGIVHKVTIGWKYKLELTGPFSAHHHHLSCLGCHEVIAIADHRIEKQLKNIAKQYHFVLQQHQLEVQGYCQGCYQKLKSKGSLPEPA